MELELGLGAYESEYDYRDVKRDHLTQGGAYPPSYTEDFSTIPVSMQNRLGICTSNLCYLIERLFEKRGVKVTLSRRFLYTVTKRMIDKNTIEGSSLRSALKAAYNYGIAPESLVPTNSMVSHGEFISEYNWPKEIWDEALKYRIGGYVSVKTDRDSLSRGIYEFGGLYARAEVGKEWYTSKDGYNSWLSSDILPLRKPKTIISGHAVVPFGYDGTGEKLKTYLRNSWSTNWADNGNGSLLLEEYYPDLTEAWGITLLPIVNTLPKPEDFRYVFNKNMWYGQTSNDVKQLQIFLRMYGYFDAVPTGSYYSLTQMAVFNFQKDYVDLNWSDYLLHGSIAGPKTRQAINIIVPE